MKGLEFLHIIFGKNAENVLILVHDRKASDFEFFENRLAFQQTCIRSHGTDVFGHPVPNEHGLLLSLFLGSEFSVR